RVYGIPPELEAIVQHCLAKDPAYRYASGTELAAAIGGMLGMPSIASLQVTGGVAASMAMAGGISATTLSSAAGATGAGPRKSSRGALFAVLGVLVVGG